MPSHHAAVEAFVAGADLPSRLIAGLSAADVDAHPVPGTWSLRTLVIHLLDSDLIATHRMKRIIAEDLPLLIAYDETAFAAKLGYDRLSLDVVVELFRLNRLHTGEILRRLPEEAFARIGVHNQRGRITLLELVEGYTQHLEHHLRFAREKLRALGRPMVV